MHIIYQIADYAKLRVNKAKELFPPKSVMNEALLLAKRPGAEKCRFLFEKVLAKKGLSFICECKKASPSRSLISAYYDPASIAKAYEAAGADCISVLTEPKWFLGSKQHLKSVTNAVKIPCIRKDFTVDEYMIYEAKILGASAVLLICTILEQEQIKDYIEICDELGMSALVEAHDEQEIEKALGAGARIIGVNNRNLKDFSVDTGNSVKLRALVPDNILFVSESGVTTPDDIKKISGSGADAVLIGETFMRAENKKELLDRFREAAL